MATICCPGADWDCLCKTKRISAAVLCLITVLCQGLGLDYYLAKHKGNAWWAWAVADAVNLAIFISAFVKSFKHLNKRARQGKPKEERQGKTKKDSYTPGGELPLGFIAWLVYACLLATRVGIIFEDLAHYLEEMDFFGPNTLKAIIALTCITFMLLIATHHDAPHESKRYNFIVSISKTVTYNIFDSVVILELLFNKDTHRSLSSDLDKTINAFACLNLILPVVPLFVLSLTCYGKLDDFQAKVVKTIHTLVNLLVINLPLLGIRMYLWHVKNINISVFFMKNCLMILFTFKELWEEWCSPEDAVDGAHDDHFTADDPPKTELNTNPNPSEGVDPKYQAEPSPSQSQQRAAASETSENGSIEDSNA